MLLLKKNKTKLLWFNSESTNYLPLRNQLTIASDDISLSTQEAEERQADL